MELGSGLIALEVTNVGHQHTRDIRRTN